jgi:hypothetical protein
LSATAITTLQVVDDRFPKYRDVMDAIITRGNGGGYLSVSRHVASPNDLAGDITLAPSYRAHDWLRRSR